MKCDGGWKVVGVFVVWVLDGDMGDFCVDFGVDCVDDGVSVDFVVGEFVYDGVVFYD